MIRFLLLLCLLCYGTAEAQDPTPVYATEFRPPQEYRQWYRQMEMCVGKRGDYSKVIWTVTPHAWRAKNSWNDSTGMVYGQWTGVGSDTLYRAIIILNADDWRIESYVKHEILHDILWRSGFKMPHGDNLLADSVNIRLRHPAPPYEKCAPTYITQMYELERQKDNPWHRVYRP